MGILKFFIKAIFKILFFTISISFAAIKFLIAIVLMVLTLGAFASSTSKY